MIDDKQIASNVLEYKKNAAILLESEISQLRSALNNENMTRLEMTIKIREAAYHIDKIKTRLTFVCNEILHDVL